MTDKITAPWTQDQVLLLNMSQQFGDPFTCCGHEGCVRSEKPNEGTLFATTEGWVCPCGKWKQDWALSAMADKEVLAATQDLIIKLKAMIKTYDDLLIDDLHMIAPIDRDCIYMVVEWTAESLQGFGQLEIVKHADGAVTIDHECMTKEFCIAVMTKVIEKYYK